MSSISLATADFGIEQVPFLANIDEWSETQSFNTPTGYSLLDEIPVIKSNEIKDGGNIALALLTARCRVYGGEEYYSSTKECCLYTLLQIHMYYRVIDSLINIIYILRVDMALVRCYYLLLLAIHCV